MAQSQRERVRNFLVDTAIRPVTRQAIALETGIPLDSVRRAISELGTDVVKEGKTVRYNRRTFATV